MRHFYHCLILTIAGIAGIINGCTDKIRFYQNNVYDTSNKNCPFNADIPSRSVLGFYEDDTMYASPSPLITFRPAQEVKAKHDLARNETWIIAPEVMTQDEHLRDTENKNSWRVLLKFKDGICEAGLASSVWKRNSSTNSWAYIYKTHEVTSCHIEFDNVLIPLDYERVEGFRGYYFSGSFEMEFVDANTGELRNFSGGCFKVITNAVGSNIIEQEGDEGDPDFEL